MAQIKDAAREHELKRWMRPDAHRFVRPDWRRFVRPGFEKGHPFALYERKYRVDQLRDELGRWADEDGASQTTSGEDDQLPTNAKPAQYGPKTSQQDQVSVAKPLSGSDANDETTELSAAGRKGDGHHYVPRAVARDNKVSDEAREVFEKAKTGPLLDTRSNKWDEEHRIYSKAVDDMLKGYIDATGPPEKMSGDQAHEFLRQLHASSDPRIRNYNLGIHIREIAGRVLRWGGRE
jgi:hypothetical protein